MEGINKILEKRPNQERGSKGNKTKVLFFYKNNKSNQCKFKSPMKNIS